MIMNLKSCKLDGWVLERRDEASAANSATSFHRNPVDAIIANLSHTDSGSPPGDLTMLWIFGQFLSRCIDSMGVMTVSAPKILCRSSF